MMSWRAKKLCDKPTGSNTNAARACSYVRGVTCSMIRPARLYPAWL
jgi:hypothetical protein